MLNEDDRHVGSRRQRFEELRKGFEASGRRADAHDRRYAGVEGGVQLTVERGRRFNSIVERRPDGLVAAFAGRFPTTTVLRDTRRRLLSGNLLPWHDPSILARPAGAFGDPFDRHIFADSQSIGYDDLSYDSGPIFEFRRLPLVALGDRKHATFTRVCRHSLPQCGAFFEGS